jgi:hypothetical protein
MEKLILPELKEAYQLTNRLPPWLRHLILGMLIWFQERYLTAKIQQTVTDAIQQVSQTLDDQDTLHWKNNATIAITENPDSLHQLPTLTISAPYSQGFKDHP